MEEKLIPSWGKRRPKYTSRYRNIICSIRASFSLRDIKDRRRDNRRRRDAGRRRRRDATPRAQFNSHTHGLHNFHSRHALFSTNGNNQRWSPAFLPFTIHRRRGGSSTFAATQNVHAPCSYCNNTRRYKRSGIVANKIQCGNECES